MEEKVKAHLQPIPEDQLFTFNNHPFAVRHDEAMDKLVESVRTSGILNPVLVRPRYNGGYEIIAGHRRTEAGRLLKLPFIPCFVCDMDDDEAIIAMIDSNLSQRENLPPSEKAFALKMRQEAARRLMLQKKGRSEHERATDSVARDTGISARQVSRFVKLTELNRQFLNMLDNGKLGMDAAVELANLSTEEQCWIYDYIDKHNMTLNTAQVKRLRQAIQQEGVLEDGIGAVLSAPVKPTKRVESKPVTEPVERTFADDEEARTFHADRDAAGPIPHEEVHAPVVPPERSADHGRVLDCPGFDCKRIVSFYPPGTPVSSINEELIRMLEVKRQKRLYGI